MDLFINILSWVLLLGGCFFVLAGSIGLLRFPDFYTRLHAAGVTDTMGAGLIIAGMIVQAGFTQVSIKLIFIFLFLMFTGPTATHALAKAALHGKLKPDLADNEARN